MSEVLRVISNLLSSRQGEPERKGRAKRKERLESESERETVFRFFAHPFQNAKSILCCGRKVP